MIDELRAAWSALSLAVRGGVVLVAVVLLVWAVASTAGWARETWRSSRYEAGQREEAQKRALAEAESAADKQRAAELEAVVEQQKAELVTVNEAIRQGGAKVEAIARDLEAERKDYEAEIAARGGPVDPDSLLERLQSRRRQRGR